MLTFIVASIYCYFFSTVFLPIFRHLKLELLAKFPALNDEKTYIYIYKPIYLNFQRSTRGEYFIKKIAMEMS